MGIVCSLLLVALASLSPVARGQEVLLEVDELAPGTTYASFGTAVSLDGTTLVVADAAYSQSGSGVAPACVYERTPTGWVEVAQLLEPQRGLSVWVDGDTAVIGDYKHGVGQTKQVGAAYVYGRDQGGPDAWGLVTTLQPDHLDPLFGGGFGAVVVVDGDRIAVGNTPWSIKEAFGAVYLFERDRGGPGAWGQLQKLTSALPTRDFGRSVTLQGDTLVVGAQRESTIWPEGAAFVFQDDGSGAWVQTQAIQPPPALATDFGFVVQLVGDTLVVGDPGAFFVFDRVAPGAGTFVLEDVLYAPGPFPPYGFGQTLALTENRLLAGASSSIQGPQIGTAHLYERAEGTFQHAAFLLASDGSVQDDFGYSVALGEGLAMVGAPAGGPGPTVHYIPQIRASALDPLTNTLYGYSGQHLVRLDPATGAGAYLSLAGCEGIEGLAFDPASATLYGVNHADGLFTIDPATGAATLVGSLDGRDLRNLAFDEASGMLFSVDRDQPYELVRIDPVGAEVFVVGPALGSFCCNHVEGLAFDAETGRLYAFLDGYTDSLYELDPSTGEPTLVGSLGSQTTARFLADRLDAGALHAGDYFHHELEALDATTAAATLIGPWGITSASLDPGSVYEFQLPTIDTSYCTAGASASGCQALLSSSGVASATAASGFTLQAGGVEGAKDGLFFFGTGGRQANPWGNGTSYQCVVPPVTRAGLLAGSGSAGLCDGAFAQDLNALWCASCPKAAKNPGAGATVQTQLWYRDPLSTSNQTTSLSEALEFVLAP